MALEGKKRSLLAVEDIAEAYITTAGFPKTSTTDSQIIPFINATGGLDIEDETTKGPGGEDMPYGQGAKKIMGKYQTEASDLALWACLNAMSTPVTANDTITKDLNGEVYLFVKDQNNNFHNFWQKADLQDFVTAPACSTSFSTKGTKLHIGNDARYIEINLQGWESAAQEAYRCGLTAYDTTATIASVVTSGCTLVTASRAARVLDKGFHSVTVGGTSIGILNDASFEDELTGGDLQHNKSAVLQRKITYKAETPQVDPNQQTSLTALGDTDTTVVMKSYAGETITINNARFKVKSHFGGRNKAFLSIEGSSTMSLSQATFTGTTATYTCNAA